MVMDKIYIVLALLMLNGNATETHRIGPITTTTITTTTTTNFCTLLLSGISFQNLTYFFKDSKSSAMLYHVNGLQFPVFCVGQHNPESCKLATKL